MWSWPSREVSRRLWASTLCGVRGERDVSGRRLLIAAEGKQLVVESIDRDAQRLQCLCRNTVIFFDQAQQDVLGPDIFALAGARRAGGQDEDPARTVGEPLEHRHSPRFTLGGERLAGTSTRSRLKASGLPKSRLCDTW